MRGAPVRLVVGQLRAPGRLGERDRRLPIVSGTAGNPAPLSRQERGDPDHSARLAAVYEGAICLRNRVAFARTKDKDAAFARRKHFSAGRFLPRAGGGPPAVRLASSKFLNEIKVRSAWSAWSASFQ